MRKSRPPKVVDREACSACGMPNALDRPSGGEYRSITITETTNGTEEVMNDDGAQGCWGCGCTARNSGGRITW